MSKRYFFIFTLLTFILTVAWIASNVYHSYATSTIDSLLTTQIQPIPQSFDTTVITNLKSRNLIEPDISSTSTLSPTPTEEEPLLAEDELQVPLSPEPEPEPSISPQTPASDVSDETEELAP